MSVLLPIRWWESWWGSVSSWWWPLRSSCWPPPASYAASANPAARKRRRTGRRTSASQTLQHYSNACCHQPSVTSLCVPPLDWGSWGRGVGLFSRHDGLKVLGSAGVDGPAQKNSKTVLDMVEVQPWWEWLSVIHTVAVFWYTASRMEKMVAGRAFLLRVFFTPTHTHIKNDSKCNTTFVCQTSWYQTRGVKCLTLQCLVLGCLCFAFHFVLCKEILAFWKWMAVGIPQGC